MSSALQKAERVTVAEYFEFENASDLKHEFVDGVIYAMVGATDRHNLIAFTMAADIFAALKPPCQVFQGQMKLRIALDDDETFYYPDVMVSCSPSDRDPNFRQEPKVLVEVISPSTERTDRKEKLVSYRQIPSLQEYVLVEQDVPKIEVFRRKNSWKPETLLMPNDVVLESIAMTIPVSQIYRTVSF